MKKLEKLNKLVFEYQCQLAEAEASGKDFEKISKLLNDTTKERKDYIAELVNRDEPMKPTKDGEHHRCPKCAHIVDNHYCSDCGQALDWSDEK